MTIQEYKGAILPQQADFAERYIANGYNGTRAAIDSGYAANSAHVTASKLLRHAKVKAYIDALSRIASEKNDITIEKQVRRIEMINNSDISQYVKFVKGKLTFKSFDELTPEQLYAIKGIKQGRNGIELILHDKSWSLDMANKKIGLYEADNKQKGEAQATAVAILLPDNGRGRVVPMEQPKEPDQK